jgi:hypothetical protein
MTSQPMPWWVENSPFFAIAVLAAVCAYLFA